MSAPLVVNTKDGACWTRRSVTEGGIALYALAGVCSCPEFVMATLDELASRGIVGSADALPMPVGPEPRSEVERLAKQVVVLQDELSEVRFDAARARRERDVIRERVSEPFGCAYCGVVKRSHGRRYITGAGMHGWTRPSDEQVKDRMLARRAARMPVGSEPQSDDRAKAPWGRGKDGRPLLPMGAHWTDVPELVDQHLAGIQARVDQAQPGSWFVSPTDSAPDTVCTQYDGYTRTVGRFANVLSADLDLVLHAHSDLRWCLDVIAKLRARVTELETELAKVLCRHAEDASAIARLVQERNAFRDQRNNVFATNEELRAKFEAQMSRADTLDRLLRTAQDRVAELEAAQGTVHRASHDSIVMGLYTTAAEARKHCETEERRSWPTGTTLAFDWIEDEDDGVAELVVTAGQNEESTTGYVVEVLEVASEYDAEADE
ncbi:hypothetical protein AB0O68_15430 [Streptomyces sp. NPDC087512]|uniref:hypothetical protein n=1 Tax=Streptomyces sp. NPDC087512 TaxID=3155059 RepID=UPI003443DFDB